MEFQHPNGINFQVEFLLERSPHDQREGAGRWLMHFTCALVLYEINSHAQVHLCKKEINVIRFEFRLWCTN